MKKHWKLIVGTLLLVFIVVFSVINTKAVSVNFGVVTLRYPLIYVIVGSAILGGLIVFISTYPTIWSQRRTLKDVQEKLSQSQTDIAEQVAVEVAEKGQKMLTELSEKEQEIAALQTENQALFQRLQQTGQLTDSDAEVLDDTSD